MTVSRRAFVKLLSEAGLMTMGGTLLAAAQLPSRPGRLVRVLPVGRFDGRPSPPLGELLGRGLDARRFTDLSTLTPPDLVTPTESFYVRTAASALHRTRQLDSIAIAGQARKPTSVALERLRSMSTDRGTHLLECAGNADPANFGLMSVARWSGVPLEAVVDGIAAAPKTPLIQITGLDDESASWESSVAGASWILSRDDIQRTGAFLAVSMNGAPLALDHGAPVRLVVPHWYACASIKWVTEITLVDSDAPATSQMKEFARRTHQSRLPDVAREFEAPTIDLAAFPVRVEQWSHDGRMEYRLVGVRWGGQGARAGLQIRFKHTEGFVPVDNCPSRSADTTWDIWTHTWRPDAPGRYQVALKPISPMTSARRLDLFFYTREVEILEV